MPLERPRLRLGFNASMSSAGFVSVAGCGLFGLLSLAIGAALLRLALARSQTLPEELALAAAWGYFAGSAVWLAAFLSDSQLLGFGAPLTWLAASHFAVAGFGALTVTALACRVVSDRRALTLLRALLLLHPISYLTIAAGISGVRFYDPSKPVVAVTLARLKLAEAPRFVRWGKPVERLVRDHPGTTLALAAMRPPRTISTFSIWRSQREMVGMVRGLGPTEDAGRHAAAMIERSRREFHREFTTLRFRAVAEVGAWNGRTNFVPK